MSSLKIKNGWICSIDSKKVNPVFGDIEINNGKISKIILGNFKLFINNPSISKKEKNTIDAEGRVITIPLVNFHEHFYSRLAKGLNISGSTDNFYNILENLWWKLDKILTPGMIDASVQMGIIESIKSGVTYVFDHHASMSSVDGSLDIIAQSLTKNNLRGVLCFEVSDRNGNTVAEKSLNENFNFISKNQNENIKGMLGLHASFTLSDETLIKASKILEELNTGIHIHLCEDKSDRKISKEKFGNNPVARLKKFNLLNNKSILAHGIHLTKNEIETINEIGSAITFNPDSNLNNSVGLPIYKNYPVQLPLLLGTDGMHSNPGKSLKNTFLLMRNYGLSFEEAFTIISKIYFDQIDFVKKYFPAYPELKPNDRADFVIWDYVPPTPINSNNFFGHYIYGILERQPEYVIQNGKILLKEKQLTGMDESTINKEIFKEGKKLSDNFNRAK